MDARITTRPSTAVEVTLTSLDPNDAHKARTLILEPSASISVGRASKSAHKNLRSSANNAYIDSPVVSRDHAILTTRATTGIPAVYIRDLGSMHGTAVNGRTLPKMQDYRLNTGDVLQFGTDVVRDAHTFVATKFRFAAGPYISTGTFALPDAELFDEEDDSISEDDSSDISDDDRSSPAVAAYFHSTPENDIHRHSTVTSGSTISPPKDAPKLERPGSQSNPVELADDEQDKPIVIIDLVNGQEDTVLETKGTAESIQQNQDDGGSALDKTNQILNCSPSVVPDESPDEAYGYVVTSPSNVDYEESDYGRSPYSASSPSPGAPTSPPFEDDNDEFGSDASVYDSMDREAIDEENYSENDSTTSDYDQLKEASSALVDLADIGSLDNDADESDCSPNQNDTMTRVKMHEMIGHHAQREPDNGQVPVSSRSNPADPVAPLDVQVKDAELTGDQPAVLPTLPPTLAQTFETRPSGSMSLKNIMHLEKDTTPIGSVLPLGKANDSKAISRHPWDWSYSYDSPWGSSSAVLRESNGFGRDEVDFALTSSRFNNPYVPPTNVMPLTSWPGKSVSSHSTCPPPSEQASIHDRTFAAEPVFDLTQMQNNGEQSLQNNVAHGLTSYKFDAVSASTSEKQNERTVMSINEIVEPTVAKEDEPVNSKKRKLATMEEEDATVTNLPSTTAHRDEMISHIEPPVSVAQLATPSKRARLRKTATAMAGIFVGTVSAVGALAFLPDVFFQ